MRPRSTLAALLIVVLAAAPAQADDSLIKNGSLDQWEGDLPAGWETRVGARRGKTGPTSVVKPVEGGGVEISGDAATKIWTLVLQPFTAKEDARYRLTFEARALDVKLEEGQFDSCYVGLAFYDAAGKLARLDVSDVKETDWTSERMIVSPPEGTVRAAAAVFIGKSGRIQARNIAVTEVDVSKVAGESFDMLVSEMDRHYSYFVHKKVDWKAITAKHREKASAAKSVKEFVAAIRPMLAALHDMHVWIDAPGSDRVVPWSNYPAENFDFKAVGRQLARPKQIGKTALVGRAGRNVYVAVFTLRGPIKEFKELLETIEPMLARAPGLILDLRANEGGDERRAQQIAALLADQRRVYAKHVVRSGPEHDAFGPEQERAIAPREEGARFTNPVVCLIGRHCVSSGEAFAAMMKALPHVKLIGHPTRGASGNPGQLELPNGVKVSFSRWVSMLPDGTVIEDLGIQPDRNVRHQGPADPTFIAARAELDRLVKAAEAKKAAEAPKKPDAPKKPAPPKKPDAPKEPDAPKDGPGGGG